VSDDWRLRIGLREGGHIHALTERLEASELEHDLETSFHDRLVVSRDGEDVFCYAGSREQAEQAAELIRALATEHGWHPDFELRRWHASAEQWEDPDVPLPQSDAERTAEHEALIQTERQELQARGYPEFEVRVQFGSHREAVRFAEKLRKEGLPSARRWKYLVVGASDEDGASALAVRLRREVGPEATVTTEATGKVAYDERPPNPFWFLGGLGG
jgi:hypothetical protein